MAQPMSFEDLLQSHQSASARLDAQLASLLGTAAPASTAADAGSAAQRARDELAAMQRMKDDAMKRYDAEIARLGGAVAQLEAQFDAQQRVPQLVQDTAPPQAQAGGAAPAKAAPPKPAAAKRTPKKA